MVDGRKGSGSPEGSKSTETRKPETWGTAKNPGSGYRCSRGEGSLARRTSQGVEPMSSKVDYSEPAAEWVEIDSIIPWPDNPKKPTRAQISRLAKLIDQLGFGAPIVARKSDRMIAIGHTRRLAAKKLGHEKVPCRFLDLTDDQL